jgi:predicted membrane-bound spermidine synthase
MPNAYLGRALLLLFVVSGVAGLIYQSIWSHYLGLVLGHAAYAQTLVLGIFMGGMALGAWLASRWSTRWRELILAYAVIEFVIGLAGLGFHGLFLGYMGFSQETVLPMIEAPWLAHAWQWLSGAALLLPQCILLGMTFPILSAAYLRLTPTQAGAVLGGLYFSNSFGAAMGALIATYLLLPAMGMPGAMLTAGLLNVLVALGAWAVWKQVGRSESGLEAAASVVATAGPAAGGELGRWPLFLLTAAAITGGTSFVYEIGWVRMLNLTLGATIHSFELMLASFIFGLACGGLWVRRKADSIGDAVRLAGWAQVWMGVAALLSVVVFAQSFRWMATLLEALATNDAGYVLFSFGSAGIALAVMFPAAFFAGMTLPLFTLALLRKGGGEHQIGRVYAANTLGAIAGVALMVHVLIPLLGLNHSVVLAALLDLALGVWLLMRTQQGRRLAWVAAFGGLAVTAIALHFGRPDPQSAASGVYRTGVARIPGQLYYFRDGKTATVTVAYEESGGPIAIQTNGKADAALARSLADRPTGDEPTMVMAAALPLALHPNPERVAVIGWGSGLTTHTLLGSDRPKVVATIEIERSMVEGAKYFGSRVERAYSDPRSQLHVDDARTYFSTGKRKFDVIVSEPSNPWVSGVASLFTQEFYQFLRRHLADDGILVQWIHVYEMNDPLLATMLAAFQAEFPESDLYVTNGSDFLLIGYHGKRHRFDIDALVTEELEPELVRLALRTPGDFALRRIGGGEVINNYVRMWRAQPHSDFFPVVGLNAPRSRFKGDRAADILDVVYRGLPVAEMLGGRENPPLEAMTKSSHVQFASTKTKARALTSYLRGQQSSLTDSVGMMDFMGMLTLRRLSSMPIVENDLDVWGRLLEMAAAQTLSQLSRDEAVGLWVAQDWVNLESQLPVVGDVMQALEATAKREPEAMLRTARVVLAHDAKQVNSYLRERILLQGQLGALASGMPEEAQALIDQYGNEIRATRELEFLRRYLLVWTQGALEARATQSPAS